MNSQLVRAKKIFTDGFIVLLEQFITFQSFFRKRVGVTNKKRDVPVIVSITSTPARLHKLHLTLETLLNQSLKPDCIALWLGKENRSLPQSIKRLEQRGVEIFYREDIGPFTKEFYTLREFPGSILVTADDDLLYPYHWLEKLYSSYRDNPQAIHCHVGRLICFDQFGNLTPYHSWPINHGITTPSLRVFPLTGPGTLFPPDTLHPTVFKVDRFLEMCPTNDDIWLKTMSLLNRTSCIMISSSVRNIFSIRGSQSSALYLANRSKNDRYLNTLFNHYRLIGFLETAT